ncbi:MAG TPA: glycyl-radical enzyme activating protein [Synergistaceae bacterium]|nr:glycyl-radical enzyme activating protein [Synergistaceae bacterium]HPJ26149.1 glycyl-radical enzyme activating protein [Synergistaceae bacterium]HPQ37179.1 glycyl-radical enzyme activating protein [Synergistaceae bacterium]
MPKSGLVFDIKRYSVHDGPGIRTTVFLKGCPLACWWCHNPESMDPGPRVLYSPKRCIGCGACVEACPRGAIRYSARGVMVDQDACIHCGACVKACPTEALEMTGIPMSVEDVMAEVLKDRAFYDESRGGVTFSGGEPLMQHEFLFEVLRACGARGIHRAVDTTGFASSEVLLHIAEETDLFLYDLKHMNPEEHKKYTGVDNALILTNLQKLASRNAEVNIRIPFIPGINDSRENLLETARFLSSLPKAYTVSLLPYHAAAMEKYHKLGRDYLLKDVLPPSEHQLRQAARIVEGCGLTVKIRG